MDMRWFRISDLFDEINTYIHLKNVEHFALSITQNLKGAKV